MYKREYVTSKCVLALALAALALVGALVLIAAMRGTQSMAYAEPLRTVSDAPVMSIPQCISPTGVSIASDSPVPCGVPMHFTATVTPSNVTSPTYAWDFGGAGSGSGTDTATPIYIYAAQGNYTVAVTVTGDCGDPVAATLPVTVEKAYVYLPLAARNYGPGRYAVVVGIADYPGSANDLNYTDDDAEDFRQMLLDRGDFTADNINLLLDSQATESNIYNAITDWLDAREDANDLVIFFFSGHGGQMLDYGGDESDGYDEYLFPYGYSATITDDELDIWLDTLESDQVVVLVDACYSGGLIGATPLEASLEGARCKCLPPLGGVGGSVMVGDGFAKDVNQSGRLVLTASQEDQVSWEFGTPIEHGAFAYYLLEALAAASADNNSNSWISGEEAYDHLDGRVDSLVFSVVGQHQNPQESDGIDGEVDLTRP